MKRNKRRPTLRVRRFETERKMACIERAIKVFIEHGGDNDELMHVYDEYCIQVWGLKEAILRKLARG